jgi:uncharacterized membrane protein
MNTQQVLIIIFSAIGVIDTSYLVYHKIKGTDVACPFFPKEWCHAVQYAPQSKTFGIPNSIAGLVMYAGLLALMGGFLKGMLPFWPVQAVVAFGFLFSMYFVYVQAFVLKAFCTWCVISAVNFTVMAAAVFLM